MCRFLILTNLIFIPIALAVAQVPSGYLCNQQVPIDKITDVPLGVGGLTFTGTTNGAAGAVELFNKTNKRVQYYVVVLEFIDTEGKYLFSAPVYNVDKDQRIPVDTRLQPWLHANWAGFKAHSAPIEPEGTAENGFDTE